MENSDHDLLLKIANDTSWLKGRLIDHEKDDAKFQETATRKIDAAHRRIDWLLVGGVLAVTLLTITVFLKV